MSNKRESVKVSIIVPVYNVEEYLEHCLTTLVHQTIDDYEVIVVNDGSPDNSQKIIDKFVEKYPNIVKSYIKKNGGLSDARNYGIEKAKGEYIAFVDSDDYVSERMFELLYNKAKEDDADVVYSPIIYLYEKKVDKKYFKERVFNKSNIKNDPYILYEAGSYAWNKIYKRSFWIDNNFTFPIQYFEDSALIYNVMLTADIVSCVNEPFYYYRQDRVGAITSTIDKKVFDIFKSVNSIVKFYKEYFKDEYYKYEKNVEYVCVKHLYIRTKALSKCNDFKMIKLFLNQMYEFLENNFSEYKKCTYLKYKKKSKLTTKVQKYLFKHKNLMIMYKTTPRTIRKILRFVYKKFKKVFFKKKKDVNRINKIKRYFIKKNGLKVLVDVQELFDSMNIMNFADFGTLLGLIRENNLLKHDLDMDIGVIATEQEKNEIRRQLEQKGYKIWRSYYFNNKIVEDSFRYKRIKVDINYYEQRDNNSITWLFYTKPGMEYENSNDRSIVEMTYSKISKTKKIKIKKYNINVPTNAKQILQQKYGKNWRTPDTEWIYWTSPAATPIDFIGKFSTYKYTNFPYNNEPITIDNKTKRLQSKELKILKEVDRICQKNNITYYLGEGTLLGARRHQGFIPWDDDIDILMPRSDYERFLKIAPEVISKDYIVQHYNITKNYWSIFMKVRLKDNTHFYQSTLEHLTEYNGPYIDIFPLDKVGDVPLKKLIKNKKRIIFFRKILSYKLGETRPKILKTKLIYPFKYIYSLNRIYKNIERLYHKYDDVNGKNYVNYASYYSIKKQLFPIECYGEPKKINYCNLILSVPQETEYILRTIYGDYMVLPTANKRKIKHSFKVRRKNK